MCAVSMVTDFYRDKWNPFDISTNHIVITKQQWEEYLELKRRMEEYDKRTNQPDCIKPEVADWEKLMEDFLKRKGIL